MRPDEHTQNLDADEVARLLRDARAGQAPLADSAEGPVMPLHRNPLPDVYPEEGK